MRSAVLMCTLLPLCAGYVTTTWRDLETNGAYSFADYLQEYQKSYSGAEHAKREAIFLRNLETIRTHNKDKTQSWKMGLNQFSDWTKEELSQKRTGLKRGALFSGVASTHVVETADIPDAVDWRQKDNVVSPVKNQGSCGSCWAFSATATLESAAAIATGKLNILAPQQYVSCAPNPQQCGGSGGCDGSTQPLAFNYSQTAGVVLETTYPYTARTTTCDTARTKNPVVGHKSYVDLPKNDYRALITAVATQGPIAISLAANFGSYEEGVFDATQSCGYDMDHAVVLVGYGHDATSNKDYWIVRNSWGASWGEQGYIRLARYGEGKEPCGMDDTPQDGEGCKGDNTPRQYCGTCGMLGASSYPTGAFNY